MKLLTINEAITKKEQNSQKVKTKEDDTNFTADKKGVDSVNKWLKEKGTVFIRAYGRLPQQFQKVLPPFFYASFNEKLKTYGGGRMFNTYERQIVNQLKKQGVKVQATEGSDDYICLDYNG